MVRLTMLLLCLLLAAAAAGRYQAEVAVRDARQSIRTLGAEKASEMQQIQMLRAEIAYLENPERLATLARKLTDLRPLSADQLMTADDFRLAFAPEGGAVVADPASEQHPVAAARVALADSVLE